MTDSVEPALYGAETITGQRWLRASRVTISNPYLGQPTISFDEERITEFDGQRSSESTRTLSADVDLAAVIDLLDPASGKPLGAQMTHGQVYAALYSLYRAPAAQLDGASQ